MAKKAISPDIDLKILEGLALGISSKELAKNYNVSVSYISKVRTGKKVPNIHISNPTIIQSDMFEVYNTDLEDIIKLISDKELIVDKKEMIDFIEIEMKKCIIKAKMYQDILRRLTNGITRHN